jgi:hypothetical protein
MLYSKAPEFSAFHSWVLCLPPRVPELPCFPCRARVPSAAGRPRAPAALLPSSTRRLVISSTARILSAVFPSPCHIGLHGVPLRDVYSRAIFSFRCEFGQAVLLVSLNTVV